MSFEASGRPWNSDLVHVNNCFQLLATQVNVLTDISRYGHLLYKDFCGSSYNIIISCVCYRHSM